MGENHLSIILLCFIFVKVTFSNACFYTNSNWPQDYPKTNCSSHLKYEEKSRTKYSCDLHKHVRNVSSS